ncbi:MAG: hypothetical protein JW825_05370 [Candidatus Methanofastidiosa archaeon]|nr:hypothetical protein [Candidatus Methanofastidiosa archaeon]
MFVLDSSAIFSGHIPSERCFITPEVEAEIKDSLSAENLLSNIGSGRIEVRHPKLEFLDKIRQAVLRTGDSLSPADVSVLALALELGATVISDDYGIQNMAKISGIRYATAKSAGIGSVFFWSKKCTGCGKAFNGTEEVCDVCGSALKKVVKRKASR